MVHMLFFTVEEEIERVVSLVCWFLGCSVHVSEELMLGKYPETY
jgi:hypothetical protein